MSYDQNITIEGTVGKEPELRFIPSGKAVVNFSVVINDNRKGDDGKWEQVGSTWWRISAWEQLAENIAESVTKGQRVIVWGSISSREYETDDGETKTATQIDAKGVGPSLKFATANVVKNERKEGNDRPAPATNQANTLDNPFGLT